MRLISEDNKRVTEAVYGRKYKLRVGVTNLDSMYSFFFLDVYDWFQEETSLFHYYSDWNARMASASQNMFYAKI